MFSGIIQSVGKVETVVDHQGDRRYRIHTGSLPIQDLEQGESIAVNGVCLTAIEAGEGWISVDVSGETISCTTFNELNAGDRVNLERALRLSDRLNGHLVLGHVDGIGEITSSQQDARSIRLVVKVSSELLPYISKKGSVCVDGTSLTVNEVTGTEFQVNIIPHTLAHTIIDGYKAGTHVNIEVDMIARYLENLVKPHIKQV